MMDGIGSRTNLDMVDTQLSGWPEIFRKITELLGPSISEALQVNRDLEGFLAPDTILRESRQLLEAIEFAHQAGYAACDHLLNELADISPINVAFTCNHPFADDSALVKTLGSEPITATYIGEGISQYSHLPRQIVKTAGWTMWYDCPSEDIRIIDWGSSFSLSERPTFISQPDNLKSPETIFKSSIDYRHDLWKAGSVVEKLGPVPPAWNSQWDEMIAGNKELEDDRNNGSKEQLITDTFEPRRQAIIQQCEEKHLVYRRDEYTDDDYEGLRCLLRPMIELLQYGPDKRVSLREALSYIDWVGHRTDMEKVETEDMNSRSE
ncbi:hypothetical protein V498_06426 [Pseudogymnoascus sp. VKM F-4517 (FW-2822)]|nr:hypothetical protein V498_06426 [Pseudogymnoascus sp. VKM F-4517 (FW-2822)]